MPLASELLCYVRRANLLDLGIEPFLEMLNLLVNLDVVVFVEPLALKAWPLALSGGSSSIDSAYVVSFTGFSVNFLFPVEFFLTLDTDDLFLLC